MRVSATISYDGSRFYGFQSQKNTKSTIIGKLQTAFKSVGIESKIVGAGRTDRGVHALGQTISFDLPHFWSDIQKLQYEINKKLKHIHLRDIKTENDDFNARFDAKKREYLYIFKTFPLSVFEENYIGLYEDFDSIKLKEILKLFEGEHDFSLFCKKDKAYKSSHCTLFKVKYKEYKKYHIIKISANRFLRSQIRLIVDASMQYATNRATKEMIIEQLQCQKKHFSSLANPNGLYLSKVYY